LKEDWFRQYINERMTNPSQQLHCRLFNGAKALPHKSSLVAEIAAASNISCINIQGFSLSFFALSHSLHSLSLELCYSLKRLGDLPNLEKLNLSECPQLVAVGKMDKLVNLELVGINQILISQFPLEQLEKLVISGDPIVNNFPHFSARLKSLKELSMSPSRGATISFIGQHFPFSESLIKLHLSYFKEVDLTGLVRLRHLTIVGIRSQLVSGKSQIYPNLRSFCWIAPSSSTESMDFGRSELTNVSEYTFISPCVFICK
jgi:hypothetical protein